MCHPNFLNIPTLPVWLQWLEAFLAMTGLVGIISWPVRRIWPNRDKWIAEFKHDSAVSKETSNLQQTLNKDWRTSWTSLEPQTSGDIYTISLGKYRVIDGIEFYEKHPTNQFPEQWSLLLENEWGGLADRPIQGQGRIVRIFPSRKIYAISIQITKPMLTDDGIPYNWRIENVRFREVKLFHRWLRMLI